MKPTVLLADGLAGRLLERIAEKFTVVPVSHPDTAALPPEASEARALITFGRFRTDQTLINSLPKLGFICCYGSGFEGGSVHDGGVEFVMASGGEDGTLAGVEEGVVFEQADGGFDGVEGRGSMAEFVGAGV